MVTDLKTKENLRVFVKTKIWDFFRGSLKFPTCFPNITDSTTNRKLKTPEKNKRFKRSGYVESLSSVTVTCWVSNPSSWSKNATVSPPTSSKKSTAKKQCLFVGFLHGRLGQESKINTKTSKSDSYNMIRIRIICILFQMICFGDNINSPVVVNE